MFLNVLDVIMWRSCCYTHRLNTYSPRQPLCRVWLKNKTLVADKQHYQQHCCYLAVALFKRKYDPTFGKYTNSNTVSLRHDLHTFIKDAVEKITQKEYEY